MPHTAEALFKGALLPHPKWGSASIPSGQSEGRHRRQTSCLCVYSFILPPRVPHFLLPFLLVFPSKKVQFSPLFSRPGLCKSRRACRARLFPEAARGGGAPLAGAPRRARRRTRSSLAVLRARAQGSPLPIGGGDGRKRKRCRVSAGGGGSAAVAVGLRRARGSWGGTGGSRGLRGAPGGSTPTAANPGGSTRVGAESVLVAVGDLRSAPRLPAGTFCTGRGIRSHLSALSC